MTGRQRQFLVTGGLGFIGSHLTEALLRQGDHVIVLDDLSTGQRDNLADGARLVVGSVTDRTLVQELIAEVDGCFHLAAIASVQRSVQAWRDCHHVNVGGSVTLFEAAARRIDGAIPVVYASSAAIYGEADQWPIAETCPPHPLTPYGADKLATELHARAGGHTLGLPSFGLRPFNVYGPRQDPRSPYSGVISIFADRAKRGLPLTLIGGGHQQRDFVHVDDAVRFFQAAMHRADRAAPVANLCTGVATTIADLADMIRRLDGHLVPLEIAPSRPGDIQRSLGDPRQAEALLGLRSTMPLESGLRSLLARPGA